MPQLGPQAERLSRLPPPLRCFAGFGMAAWLDRLERLVLRSRALQSHVLAVHRRALATVLQQVREPGRILVVGGGLFPRTAILLRERWPRAHVCVLDRDPDHLVLARRWLPEIELRCGSFPDAALEPADLVVLPLALRGSRSRALAAAFAAGARHVLVHDWWWRCPPSGVAVGGWLLKGVWLATSSVVPAMPDAPGLVEPA
ncbi:MAG: hypothetical protein JNK15_10115 [Planctomycetes bacterium]|nr:hypothetical protein [Planctomycetota bacterium]